jgi:hypothetical protein
MRKIGIIASIVVAVVAISAISYTAIIGSKTAVGQEGMAVDVVRDTVQVILDHKRINANDFIHLYDSAPYHIMNGHVALKMPCDANGNPMPRVKVMAGNADMGMFEELDMNLLEKVSTKGKMCVWHADLESTHEKDKALGMITDVIIMNDSNTPIRFPAGSSVVVGVNEIMKGEEHKEGMHEERKEGMH